MNPLPAKKISENLYVVKTWTVNFYIILTYEAVICIDAENLQK